MIWNVFARYVMRGGGRDDFELVHLAYEEADTAEAALAAVQRRGIATEAHEADRRRYVDLVAEMAVYYAYDSNDDFMGFANDISRLIVFLINNERLRFAPLSILIGDTDGPDDTAGILHEPGEFAPEEHGYVFEITRPQYVPAHLRHTEWTPHNLGGHTVTMSGVPAWYVRASAGTQMMAELRDSLPPATASAQTREEFRAQLFRSPVQPAQREEDKPIAVMSLEESQAARFGGLELGPAAKTADDDESSGASARFKLLELNPPRLARAQKVIAKLSKQPAAPVFPRGSVVTNADELMLGLVDYIGDNAHEYFLMIFVNIRNHVIGYAEFTSGDMASVEVSTSGIFRAALGAGAAAIITVHQHPTGDPDPSPDDVRLWARLREAGKIVGIPVIDNLVLGERRYYSEYANEQAPIPASTLREAAAQRASDRRGP